MRDFAKKKTVAKVDGRCFGGIFILAASQEGGGASLSAAGKEARVSQTLLLLLPSLLLSTRLFKAAKVGENSPNIFFKQKTRL